MGKKLTYAESNRRFGAMLTVPAVLYLLLAMLIPIIWAVMRSMQDKWGDFIGVEAYVRSLKDPVFYTAIFNTFAFAFCAVVGKTIMGMITALVLNENFRLRFAARSFMLLPWAIPGTIAVLTWRWMFSDVGGSLNYLLKMTGLIQKDILWLSSSSAFWAIVMIDIWRGTPFMGLSILSGLQSISHDLYEAAMVDGANTLQRFRFITLPQIKYVVLSAATMTTIWTLNAFETTWLLTRGGPGHITELISTYSYKTGFMSMDIGKSLAITVLTLPLFMLLVNFVTKYTLEGDQ